MRRYLFISVLFFFSCRKQLEQQQAATSFSYAQISGKLAVNAITAPTWSSTYVGKNVLDGNLSTLWTSETTAKMTLTLSGVQTVGSVKIAFFTGGVKTVFYTFDVLVSTDSVSWKKVVPGARSTPNVTALQSFAFPDVSARYVQILGYGNNGAGGAPKANSYTEVEVWGSSAAAKVAVNQQSYGGYDKRLLYTGRVDVTGAYPRFAAPGVYLSTNFTGTSFALITDDQMPGDGKGGSYHNALAVSVDGGQYTRITLKSKTDTTLVASGLEEKAHSITIVKETEAFDGWMDVISVRCAALLQPNPAPSRAIEFVGDSWTAGASAITPCSIGQPYDHNAANETYGAQAAHALNARYMLTAEAGIGMTRSNYGLTMPMIYDKLNFANNTGPWDFQRYVPDVVVIALGQNDGGVDSATFCRAYAAFINTVKKNYSHSVIICATSAMGTTAVNTTLLKYLKSSGQNVFQWSKRYSGGCDGHPSVADHAQMTQELVNYIRNLMKWR